MITSQLNVEIPLEDILKAKRDALDLNVSMAAYTRTALQFFRASQNKDQRRAKFTKNDSKTVGRKLK